MTHGKPPSLLRRKALIYSPRLELLEDRLPPGDALLGILLGMSLFDRDALEVSIASPAASASERVSPLPDGRGSDELPDTADIEARVWQFHQESSTSADDSRISRATSSSPLADPLASPFESGVRAPAFRRAISTGIASPQLQPADSRAATVRVSGNNPTFTANVQLTNPTVAVPSNQPTDDDLKPESTAAEADKAQVTENFGKLPLSFEQNVGQFDDRVDFVTRAGGATVFLTPTAAVFSLQNSESRIQKSESETFATSHPLGTEYSVPSTEDSVQGVAVYMNIVGANPNAAVSATDWQPGIVNYFIGNDPAKWRTNISTFGRVEYDDVYPGIDLVYYGTADGQLEYDFVVAPGADPNAITLNFAGADGVEINGQGDLVLHTAVGDVGQQKPFTYQEIGATRYEVASRYLLEGTSVAFEVGAYDATRPLVIDPLVMEYSTYLGGPLGDEFGNGITSDDAGNAYVAGSTSSAKFPAVPGAFDPSFNGGGTDGFVTKLNVSGEALVYSTYFGGSDIDAGRDIAVDGSGNAFVTGQTGSSDFPTTPGSFDTTINSGTDVFVTKLNDSGAALVYSTYLGESGHPDYGPAIDVDSSGNAYVTGSAGFNFPSTPSAFDTTYSGNIDAFVTKLRADGTGLLYSTFLGAFDIERGWDIAVDSSGNAYVTGDAWKDDFPTTAGAFDATYNGGGPDVFVTKLSADGDSLLYSTFLGGSNFDSGYGIAVDGSGNAYVTGRTDSDDFPTTPGAFDETYNGGSHVAFVTKLNATGSALVYSTYLGEGGPGYGIAVDTSGNVYVTGYTSSSNFPTTPGAFDITWNGGFADAYVAKLNVDGSALVYSTFLGAADEEWGQGIAVDISGNVYVTGWTKSGNFPTTPSAFKRRNRAGVRDAFVTKFAEV